MDENEREMCRQYFLEAIEYIRIYNIAINQKLSDSIIKDSDKCLN